MFSASEANRTFSRSTPNSSGLIRITVSQQFAILIDSSSYFGMQIFQKIKKETQEFFLKTAFLPTVTVRVAEKLSGFSASEQILSDLGENHYFTESHPQSPPVYQYHPLFREFLFSRARDSYSTDEISRIQQSAALLLEESGQEYDAVSLLGKAKDWGNLIRVILSRAHALMVQGGETEKPGETENTRRRDGERGKGRN